MGPAAASTSATLFENIALESLGYSLDYNCPVPWSSLQEAAISQDYPFPSIDGESTEIFVIRRYLETLWLPESIMPLHHFIHSLRRVRPSSSGSHPLHEAINPLLLSVRATQNKYHVELPQILQDGGGAGELEETVMWYVWSKEKFESDGKCDNGEPDEKVAEDAWRKRWMERLEHREVQIQILLYLELLSLPPLPPNTPVAPSPKKRKQKGVRGPPSPVKPNFPPTSSFEVASVAPLPPTPARSTKFSVAGVEEDLSMEDRLEYFMDRLSLWQLVASLNPPNTSQPMSSQPTRGEQRDWMQTFCEDVVEPLFKDRLPDLCALLRTKVFPHSPFSEDFDSASSPPPPDLRTATKGRSKHTRPTSPLRLQELEKPRAAQSRAESVQPPSGPADSWQSDMPNRHRSRSRSVSVSVEEVRARGASRGGVASSKNLFQEEVEMKRTTSRGSKLFKPPADGSQQEAIRSWTRQNFSGNTFPKEAQVCPPQPRSPSQVQGQRTLAADTPVKKLVKIEDAISDIVMDSPDALLLGGQSRWNHVENQREEEGTRESTIFAADTPVKRRSRY